MLVCEDQIEDICILLSVLDFYDRIHHDGSSTMVAPLERKLCELVDVEWST